MRNLTSQMLALTNSSVFPAAIFCRIPWQYQVLNVWSGQGPIAFGGTGVHPPTHEWTLNTIGTTISDQWNAAPMKANNLAWVAYAGMGPVPVASFNGSTSYLETTGYDGSLSFDGTRPFSISLWAVLATENSSQNTLFSSISSTSPYAGMTLAVTNGQVDFQMINSYPSSWLQVYGGSASTITTGNVYHILVTYDGSGKGAGVAIYVNGALQTPTIYADMLTGSANSNLPVAIGSRPGGNSYPVGSGGIAFVQIYDVALTSANAAALYAAGPSPASKLSAVTFQGVGSLGSISTITEVSSVNATGVTLTLSGLDPATLQDGLTQLNQGDMAQIFMGAVVNGVVVDYPVLLYQGLTDQVTVDVSEKTATVKLSLESRLSDLQRSFNQKYTAQWQEQRYPGDTCLNSVEKLIDCLVKWGGQ